MVIPDLMSLPGPPLVSEIDRIGNGSDILQPSKPYDASAKKPKLQCTSKYTIRETICEKNSQHGSQKDTTNALLYQRFAGAYAPIHK